MTSSVTWQRGGGANADLKEKTCDDPLISVGKRHKRRKNFKTLEFWGGFLTSSWCWDTAWGRPPCRPSWTCRRNGNLWSGSVETNGGLRESCRLLLLLLLVLLPFYPPHQLEVRHSHCALLVHLLLVFVLDQAVHQLTGVDLVVSHLLADTQAAVNASSPWNHFLIYCSKTRRQIYGFARSLQLVLSSSALAHRNWTYTRPGLHTAPPWLHSPLKFETTRGKSTCAYATNDTPFTIIQHILLLLINLQMKHLQI